MCADIPATLPAIYLSILCKANDVKQFGYAKVLDPLLKNLKIISFENNGIFVPSLGKVVKGTVLAVAADNLGSHSIAGFVSVAFALENGHRSRSMK